MSGNSHVRVGVGVLVCRDGKVLMGRRMGKNGYGTWSMPGGHLDNGETPEQTAIRETLEETGLKVVNPQFAGFTNDIFPDQPGKHYITIWIATDWRHGEPVPTSTKEMDEFCWVSLDALPEPIFFPLQNLLASSFRDTAFTLVAKTAML